VLVFQDTTGLDDEAALDQQRALVEVLRDVEPEPGVSVEPFAFGLLLEDPDIGGEIGRLFGTALLVILLVLAVVYRVRARPWSARAHRPSHRRRRRAHPRGDRAVGGVDAGRWGCCSAPTTPG
jgi:hypothetical protein